ncbi:MAG: response regulator transcription factor, partial [Alistipes sp.]|nr:response regulator transcription factor [Alistipes sp.]
IETPIIFTTAYDQYAIDAFKVNSVDYLLKPVKLHELVAALSKFRKLSTENLAQYIERLSHLRPARKYRDKMLITYKDKIIPINTADIACFYNTDRTTHVIMFNGDVYQYATSLEQMMQALDPALFMRVNKQYILSRNCIGEITVWFNGRLRISTNVDVPEQIFISKNRASEFKSWLINEEETK